MARLREDVGGAEAAGMLGVALDLGRPPFVALDQQAGRHAAERHRGREEQRPAGDDLLGLPDVGDDLLSGWRVQAVTPASASDAPISFRNVRRVDRIGDRLDLGRELVVQPLAEGGIVGQLVERPPAYRGCARDAVRRAVATTATGRDSFADRSSSSLMARRAARELLNLVLGDQPLARARPDSGGG